MVTSLTLVMNNQKYIFHRTKLRQNPPSRQKSDERSNIALLLLQYHPKTKCRLIQHQLSGRRDQILCISPLPWLVSEIKFVFVKDMRQMYEHLMSYLGYLSLACCVAYICVFPYSCILTICIF